MQFYDFYCVLVLWRLRCYSVFTFTPGNLKNMPSHSGNQTYDVLNVYERNDRPWLWLYIQTGAS